MNELFIVDQNKSTILNLNKLRDIQIYAGTVEAEDTKNKFEAYEISASMDYNSDAEASSVSLGFYLSEEQTERVFDELIGWLSEKNDYRRVFLMPPVQEEVETVSDTELELDYSDDSDNSDKVNGDE